MERNWRSPRVAAGLCVWIRRRAASDWEPPLEACLLGSRFVLASVAPPQRQEWLAYLERLFGEFKKLVSGPFVEFESDGLRRDQILAARQWGIAFRDRPELDRDAVHVQLMQLVQRAREAAKIFELRPEWRDLAMPGLLADALEALMRDVLNEERQAASRASLIEDFLERTDLRVQYPELERKRGARVQVSWSATPEAQLEKSGSFVRHEEYVFLSPWELSRHSQRWKQPEQWFAAFKKALRARQESPHGPMAEIAPAMRDEIRAFVHREALRTTQTLREREAESGQFHTRRKRPKLTGGRDAAG